MAYVGLSILGPRTNDRVFLTPLRLSCACRPEGEPERLRFCELPHSQSPTPVAFCRDERPQSTAEDDMSRVDFAAEYRRLNAEDKSAFRKWLIANTVFGAAAIFALIVLTSVYSGGDGSMTAHKQEQVTTVR